MMGHGSHHTLVTTVMDHLSLSVLRGEVFKEHDPRLQNANVYTKTQKHRTQPQWYNLAQTMRTLYFLCTVH